MNAPCRLLAALVAVAALLPAPSAWAIANGEVVTVTAKWEGPDGTSFDIDGATIRIVDQSNSATLFTDTIQKGSYTFTSPKDNLMFRYVLTPKHASFDVVDPSLPAPGLQEFTAASDNLLTYLAKKRGPDAQVWSVFHGVAELVALIASEMKITKNTFKVTFPFPTTTAPFTTHAPGDDLAIILQDRYDWDVFGHEIGHALDHQRSAVATTPAGDHDGSNQYDVKSNAGTFKQKGPSLILSLSEGFGTWFGVSLLLHSQYRGKFPNVGDTVYNDTEDSKLRLDLELNTSARSHGEDAEFSIASLFWDLADSDNEQGKRAPADAGLRDQVNLGAGGVFTALDGKSTANIFEFWKNAFVSNNADVLPAAPGAVTSPDLLKEAARAATTFAEFGIAPTLSAPKRDTVIELSATSTKPKPTFKWSQLATVNADIALKQYTLALYNPDFSELLFRKDLPDGAALRARTYALTEQDIADLKAKVDALEAAGTPVLGLQAIIYGSSSVAPATGPYPSNAMPLAIENVGRAVVAVVDSSGSNTTTDPSNLRIKAAQDSLRVLISAKDAKRLKKPSDLAAAIDFDSSVSVLSNFDDPDVVIPTLDAIDSSGGTSIDSGINQAVALLEALNVTLGGSATKNALKDRSGILLFTDGENNAGDPPVIAAIDAAGAKGFRVHYGFLQPQSPFRTFSQQLEPIPAPPALAAAAQIPPPPSASIQEAVLNTGGVFGILNTAAAQLGFVQQVFSSGITNGDSSGLQGGKLPSDILTQGRLTDGQPSVTYSFRSISRRITEIRVDSSAFIPQLTLFNKKKKVVAVDTNLDGDGTAVISSTKLGRKDYTVEVFNTANDRGDFTIVLTFQKPVRRTALQLTSLSLTPLRAGGKYFVETVEVANQTGETVSGVRLIAETLAPGDRLFRSSGVTAEGEPTFESPIVLAPGASARISVEVQTADAAFAGLDLEAEPIALGSEAGRYGVAIPAQRTRDAQGRAHLTWTSKPGRLYWVQHTADGLTHALVSDGLLAPGTAGHWTDPDPARGAKGSYLVIESAAP